MTSPSQGGGAAACAPGALRRGGALDGLRLHARVEAGPPASAAAGRDGPQAPAIAPLRRPGDEALLAGLRDLARSLGRDHLVQRDLEGRPGLTIGVFRHRFGSLRAALAAAGLVSSPADRRYSDVDCFVNLAAMWRLLGRPPLAGEIDRPPSTVGSAAYRARAGSWKRAVEAYAAFTGADPTCPGPPGRIDATRRRGLRRAAAANDEEAPRRASGDKTPLSLRFKVLQRDRFRCVACGNSPVHDAQCQLQVDHIVPRAEGGGDDPANLRSLCASCNRGRGRPRAAQDKA